MIKSQYYLSLFLLFILCSAIVAKDNNAKEQNYINIGYSSSLFSEINPNDVKAISNILADQLGTSIPNRAKFKSNTIIFENSDHLISLVKGKELDIIGLSGLEYIAVADKCNIEPVGVHYSNNSPYEEFILVVHADKRISNLKQLKGKSLVLADKYSDLAKTWLEYLIGTKTEASSYTEFFGEVRIMDKSSSLLMQVLLGQKDAALVNKKVFDVSGSLNPQIKQKLKVIEESPGFILGMVCVRNNLDENMVKSDIANELFNLQNSKAGRQILQLFSIEKLIKYKSEYMKSIEDVYNFTIKKDAKSKTKK